MRDTVNSQRRVSVGEIFGLTVPFAGLVAAYAFLNHLQLGISNNYDRYREFWGGNPSEVFSHWLDMVLMSGGAAVTAWLTSGEAFFRRSGNSFLRRLAYVCGSSLLVLSGVIAIVVDGLHGEGTVMIVYPMFFIPMLVSSYYLVRRFGALLHWNPVGVIALSFGLIALHTAAQLYYEPSGTGGPNQRIVPLWFASVGGALIWAFVRSIRTGLLARILVRAINITRKPTV